MSLLFKEVKTKIKNIENIENYKNYLKFYLQLQKLKSKKKRKKFCFYTSNKRGIFSYFDLSRQTLKEFACNEYLPGLIKSSW